MFRANFVTLALVALLLSGTAFGQFAGSGTTNITVTVAAEASIQVNASTPLTTTGTLFSNYTGTTGFMYKIRTTATGGSGSITARVTTDFSPGGGPSVASPPTAGDTLAYTCTVAAPGTGCVGSQTASTTADTNVSTFGANARSARDGNSGSLAWTLTNDPAYATGNYTAVVTLTIGAV